MSEKMKAYPQTICDEYGGAWHFRAGDTTERCGFCGQRMAGMPGYRCQNNPCVIGDGDELVSVLCLDCVEVKI